MVKYEPVGKRLLKHIDSSLLIGNTSNRLQLKPNYVYCRETRDNVPIIVDTYFVYFHWPIKINITLVERLE